MRTRLTGLTAASVSSAAADTYTAGAFHNELTTCSQGSESVHAILSNTERTRLQEEFYEAHMRFVKSLLWKLNVRFIVV